MRHSTTIKPRTVVTALAAALLSALQVVAFQGSPALAQTAQLKPNPQIQVE
jgi:hypothetical protein